MQPRPRIDTTQMLILVTVVREGSLSRAAQRLGLAASTLSYALSHLTAEFDDVLFSRKQGKLAPTRRGQRLAEEFQRVLDSLSDLRQPEDYDPALDEGTISIAANYYERLSIIPGLVRVLSTSAPKLQIAINAPVLNGVSALQAGVSDLQLSAVPMEGGLFTNEVILSDSYKCYACKDAAYRNKPLTLDAYRAARHIVVSYDQGWRPYYMVELERAGYQLEPSLKLASLGGISEILTGSDYLLTAAARLRKAMGPDVVELQPPFTTTFNVYMSWPRRLDGDRRNQWLRGLVREVVQRAQAVD